MYCMSESITKITSYNESVYDNKYNHTYIIGKDYYQMVQFFKEKKG